MASTALHFNKEYLRKHYKEMVDVDDAPLPMGLLDIICPEFGDYCCEKVASLKVGEENVYSRYKEGFFSREGEDFFAEGNRLIREYIMKHPEHKDLIVKDDAGILDYLYE